MEYIDKESEIILKFIIKTINDKHKSLNAKELYELYGNKVSFDSFYQSVAFLKRKNYISGFFGDGTLYNINYTKDALCYFTNKKKLKLTAILNGVIFPILVSIVVSLITSIVAIFLTK